MRGRDGARRTRSAGGATACGRGGATQRHQGPTQGRRGYFSGVRGPSSRHTSSNLDAEAEFWWVVFLYVSFRLRTDPFGALRHPSVGAAIPAVVETTHDGASGNHDSSLALCYWDVVTDLLRPARCVVSFCGDTCILKTLTVSITTCNRESSVYVFIPGHRQRKWG